MTEPVKDIFEKYAEMGFSQVTPELLMDPNVRDAAFYYNVTQSRKNMISVVDQDPSQPYDPAKVAEIDKTSQLAQVPTWIKVAVKEENRGHVIAIPVTVSLNPSLGNALQSMRVLSNILMTTIEKGDYKFEKKDISFPAQLPNFSNPGQLGPTRKLPLMYDEFKSNLDPSGTPKPMTEDDIKAKTPQLSAFADVNMETTNQSSHKLASLLQPIFAKMDEYMKVLFPMRKKDRLNFAKACPFVFGVRLSGYLAFSSLFISKLQVDAVSIINPPPPAGSQRAMVYPSTPCAIVDTDFDALNYVLCTFVELYAQGIEDWDFEEDSAWVAALAKQEFAWSLQVCVDNDRGMSIIYSTCPEIAGQAVAKAMHYLGLVDMYVQTGHCAELSNYAKHEEDFAAMLEYCKSNGFQFVHSPDLHDVPQFSNTSLSRQSLADFLSQSYNKNPIAMKAIKTLTDELIVSKEDVLHIEPNQWKMLQIPIGAKNRAIKWAKGN